MMGISEKQSRPEGLRRVGSEGEEGQAKYMVLLHCVEGHSLQIDVHKKGGVETSVVTKMSYCAFAKRETKRHKQ